MVEAVSAIKLVYTRYNLRLIVYIIPTWILEDIAL